MIPAFLVAVGLTVAIYLGSKRIRDSKVINYTLALIVVVAVLIFIYEYTYLGQGIRGRL